ncbi:MAG: TMEM175 family protein [Panacibacter sp.]
MGKARLEAFSDGVIAIIITIMVLEMKVPHGDSIEAIKPLLPVFISYVISFINVGIYWNNHHHMLHAAHHVDGKVLWANIHLLFWLSLIPFGTAWMGENHFTVWPVAIYGMILFMCGLAYYILAKMLVKLHGKSSTLAIAIGRDRKGVLSLVFYFFAIALAFVNAWISLGLIVFVAAMWFIPDRRIEKKLVTEEPVKEKS